MPLLLRAALPGDVGCVYVRSGAMDTGSLMGMRALRDSTEGSLLTIACVSTCPKIYYSGSSFFQRPPNHELFSEPYPTFLRICTH